MASDITKMARLVKIVSLLRQNVYPNHKTVQKTLRTLDIAGAYNVSQKTIQRDIQYLRDMYAAPIAFDNGKRGYYLTDQTWTFEVPSLDAAEMQAVTIGARLAENIMPEPVSRRIRNAADTLLCENPTGLDVTTSLIALVAKGARIPVKPEIFQEVFTAWQTSHGLSVKYSKASSGQVVSYVLEPHILSFYDGLWYVKAVIVSENGETLPERFVRTLALNRFQFAAIYPGKFTLDMRLVQEVNEGNLFNFPVVEEVVLRFTDYAIPYARENYEPELIEEQSDGSLLVTIYDVPDFKIINLVLNEGGAVQVISPSELAEKVIAQAEQVIKANKQTNCFRT